MYMCETAWCKYVYSLLWGCIKCPIAGWIFLRLEPDHAMITPKFEGEDPKTSVFSDQYLLGYRSINWQNAENEI